MARAPSAKVSQAEQMYLAGQKLIDIARQLDVPEGTVRRWKCTYKWDSERSDKKASVRKKEKKKKQNEEAAAELVDQESDLTDKQRLFCLYYVRTFNATKAYQKAYGCRYEVARSIAYRQLHKEAILQEIQRTLVSSFQKLDHDHAFALGSHTETLSDSQCSLAFAVSAVYLC